MPYPRFASALLLALLISNLFAKPLCGEVSMSGFTSTEREKQVEAMTLVQKLTDEGLRYQNTGQFEKAVEKYQAALMLAQEKHDTPSIAVSFFMLGTVYNNLEHWQGATEAFKQAIQLKSDFAEAHYGLGVASGQLGRWPEAVEAYKQAVQLKPDYVNAYNNLGTAYGWLARWLEAKHSYQRALEIAREQKNVPAEVVALGGLARVSDALGDIDNSQRYLLETTTLYRRMGNHQQEAYSLAEIGRLYLDMSRYDEALNSFHQALEKYREAKDLKGQGKLLTQIGDIYSFWLGDAQTAMSWYQDALEVAKTAGDVPGELRTLAMLLLADSLLGNQASFQEHAVQADKTLKETIQQLSPSGHDGATQQGQQAITEKFLALAHLAQIVGGIYARAGLSDQAISELNGSLQIHQKFSQTKEILKETAIDYYYLGIAYGRLNHYDEALKNLRQAEEIARQINSPEIRWVLNTTGVVQEAQGRLQEALSSYIQASEVLEKVSFHQRSQEIKIPLREFGFNVYGNIVRLLYKLYLQDPRQHYIEQAFIYYEKGKARSLLDLLAEAKVHIREGVDRGLLKEEEQISTRIALLHRVLAEPTLTKEQEKPLLVALEAQEQALQALQVKMTIANPKYAALTSPQTVDISQVQAILDKDTLLLEYVLGEEQSFLWAITQKGMHGYELPKEEEINRQIEQYLPTLKFPLFGKDEIGQHVALGKGLYRTLLQPAANQLKERGKVIIVPDGSLYSLPFEALIVDDGKEDPADRETLYLLPYFINNYTITYAPSASVLVALEKDHKLHLAKDSSQSPLLAFGAPVPLPDGFERLRYAAEEVQKIAGILGSPLSSDAVNLQEQATKKRLREIDLSRYRMLHFATHAVLSEPTQRITQPALVLSLAGSESPHDSFLQMGEIFNLRLNADLVVLSACDTGRGKTYRGEGVVGLTRSFMYAGTPSVVASLWRVSDESTSRLMEFFYRNLKEGRSKAEALRQAKIELMQTLVWNEQSEDEFPKFASPYFWAPFILMGSGS